MLPLQIRVRPSLPAREWDSVTQRCREPAPGHDVHLIYDTLYNAALIQRYNVWCHRCRHSSVPARVNGSVRYSTTLHRRDVLTRLAPASVRDPWALPRRPGRTGQGLRRPE